MIIIIGLSALFLMKFKFLKKQPLAFIPLALSLSLLAYDLQMDLSSYTLGTIFDSRVTMLLLVFLFGSASILLNQISFWLPIACISLHLLNLGEGFINLSLCILTFWAIFLSSEKDEDFVIFTVKRLMPILAFILYLVIEYVLITKHDFKLLPLFSTNLELYGFGVSLEITICILFVFLLIRDLSIFVRRGSFEYLYRSVISLTIINLIKERVPLVNEYSIQFLLLLAFLVFVIYRREGERRSFILLGLISFLLPTSIGKIALGLLVFLHPVWLSKIKSGIKLFNYWPEFMPPLILIILAFLKYFGMGYYSLAVLGIVGFSFLSSLKTIRYRIEL